MLVRRASIFIDARAILHCSHPCLLHLIGLWRSPLTLALRDRVHVVQSIFVVIYSLLPPARLRVNIDKSLSEKSPSNLYFWTGW